MEEGSSVLHASVPTVVLRLFPHLGQQLAAAAEREPAFLELCEDYSSIMTSIEQMDAANTGDREELLSLKSSLEAEILERVSRHINEGRKE